ncbi:MAG: hypothetical protein K8S23_08100 [Candidatus Cloacimonetes bacterium]|nr:hypothetical protein [Candidatus Cloacimonadota bacterium]
MKILLISLLLISLKIIFSNEIVFLIHGIKDSPKDMRKIEKAIFADYEVVNFSYPSSKLSISELVDKYLEPELAKFSKNDTIHFVTHSMGGILLRVYLEHYSLENIGKIIMIAPPNQGSEVTDFFHRNFIYKFRYGPAGQELTENIATELSISDSLQQNFGIISGSGTQLPFFSCFIDGEDDGKISTERTKLKGMQDFIILPYPHDTILKKKETIKQIVWFLKYGKFTR